MLAPPTGDGTNLRSSPQVRSEVQSRPNQYPPNTHPIPLIAFVYAEAIKPVSVSDAFISLFIWHVFMSSPKMLHHIHT